MAISIYETQNLSVILSDCLLDVNEFGIDIYLNSHVSVIVDNSTISAFKPLDFVDTTYSKLFVKDSTIITKTIDNSSEAFSTYNGSFNDIRFINTHFDVEGENLYYISKSNQEPDHQNISFTECVFNINHPVFAELFFSESANTYYSFSNGTIVIKEGVTDIRSHGFEDMNNISTVILPSSLKTIGDYAFFNCNHLNAIVIPEGVTSIGTGAFQNNLSLTSAVIPSTVTSMGTQVFTNANALLNIYVIAEANYSAWPIGWNGTANIDTWVKEVGYISNMTYVAMNTGVIRIIDYLSYEVEDVVIPESIDIEEETYIVKEIMPYAFAFNKSLKSIVIPNTILEISEYAFYASEMLETVEFLPISQLTYISDFAFSDCYSLKSIVIPNTVTYLGQYAFASNRSLESVEFETGSLVDEIFTATFSGDILLKTINIPARVSVIGQSAFNNNKSLTQVTFEEGSILTSIGNYAFYSCYSLDNFILPDTVATIGEYAFGYNESMTNFIINDTSSLTTIGSSAFYYNLNLTDINLVDSINSIGMYAFAYNSSLTEITLPANITFISNHLFYTCENLVTVNIPENSVITEVDDYAFSKNESLEYINLPDGVERIGVGAFYLCKSLVKMYIPSGILIIDSYAFTKCENMTEIIFDDVETLTTIGSYAFSECFNLSRFYIPESVVTISTYAFRYSLEVVIYVEADVIPGTWNVLWASDTTTPIKNASYIKCIQNNGDDSIMIYGVVGDPVSAPMPTIYEGYVFDDWYIDIITDYIVYEFTTMPDDPVTVYAEWDPFI